MASYHNPVTGKTVTARNIKQAKEMMKPEPKSKAKPTEAEEKAKPKSKAKPTEAEEKAKPTEAEEKAE